MQGSVCFDTTGPLHMVRCSRGHHLERAFAGRAVWPPAVHAELVRHSRTTAGLRLFADGPFATVIELEPDEEQLVEDLRLETLTRAELRSNRTKNRGEAECVVVAARLGIPLVVHDEVGREWARRLGVTLFNVVDCLYACVAAGHLRPADGWRSYEQCCSAGMFPVAGYSMTTAGRGLFMGQAEAMYSEFVASTSDSA